MQVEPYLFFDGRCEEALKFYQQALGAEVTGLLRYRESPQPEEVPAGAEDKIMHALFRLGNSTVMVSDDCTGHPTFQGFALTLSVAEPAEAEGLFNALADGGRVQMPLAKTFWSPLFGMVADRFGVLWMVTVFEPGS